MANGIESARTKAAELSVHIKMIQSKVIIVGGGPAGSTCAWKLKQQGVECLILDKAKFPRIKLCAGWITPQVFQDLEITPNDYPHSLVVFDKLDISLFGLRLKSPGPQYSIRRFEFDQWLLNRAGVPVHHYGVKKITREGNYYIIDNAFRCQYLVGAGGTNCPVYHTFFKRLNPRQKELRIDTLEQEIQYQYNDSRCHLWFMEHHLDGYSWYVPKGNGWLNVGVGGFAASLKKRGDNILSHWYFLVEKLNRLSLFRDYDFKPKGYIYYLRSSAAIVRSDNAFIIGDAVGLATKDMGEGIGPAVQSGIKAAMAIADNREYTLSVVREYSDIMPSYINKIKKLLRR